MFSVPHLVIIFIVVLVVFGPHKLPELARSLGKMMAEFRKASTDFKMAFEEEMRTMERQARDVEFKKSQEAAAASSTELQPATLGTPAGAETPHILPESIEPIEPTITPVSEAVAHEAHSYEELPITEGTPAPEAVQATESTGTGESPAHDQQQPA